MSAAVGEGRAGGTAREGRWAHVVLIGSGNIGSHTTRHVARQWAVRRMTVIDPDVYDATNVRTQDISFGAVGESKARYQAELVRAIDPTLEVVALAERVEDVPLGLLRADVLLSSPDSRRARLAVNGIAWRLGVPWVDAGVDARGGLARVTVRVPSAGAGCLRCGFGPADEEALSWEYGCGAGAARATGAASWLGGVAASLQAAECARLLGGEAGRGAEGWQWTVDTAAASSVVTKFRRNIACPFDHETWRIARLEKSPSELSLGEAMLLDGAGAHAKLRLHGHSFVTRLVCAGCGATRSLLHVARRLSAGAGVCPACSGPLTSSGLDDLDAIDPCSPVMDRLRDTAMSDFGFRPGDVLTVGRAHYELGGPNAG